MLGNTNQQSYQQEMLGGQVCYLPNEQRDSKIKKG